MDTPLGVGGELPLLRWGQPADGADLGGLVFVGVHKVPLHERERQDGGSALNGQRHQLHVGGLQSGQVHHCHSEA